MKTRILNSIGLFLGIIGVLMIFKWGPPQPSFSTGIGISLEDNTPIDKIGKTVAEYNREVTQQQALYSRMSKIGLAFIAFGFSLQFIAVWVDKFGPKQTNARDSNSDNNKVADNPKETFQVRRGPVDNSNKEPKGKPKEDD